MKIRWVSIAISLGILIVLAGTASASVKIIECPKIVNKVTLTPRWKRPARGILSRWEPHPVGHSKSLKRIDRRVVRVRGERALSCSYGLTVASPTNPRLRGDMTFLRLFTHYRVPKSVCREISGFRFRCVSPW